MNKLLYGLLGFTLTISSYTAYSTVMDVVVLDESTPQLIVPQTGVDAYAMPVTLDAGTGNEIAVDIQYTVNKASSGNDTGVVINQTDTASPGTSLLLDLQVGGTPKFSVNNAGQVVVGTLTAIQSIIWNAGSMSADGTQCADPSEVTINSGPIMYTVICTDNDASTLYGHMVMPDSWNAGTVTFELEYLQTAADTSALNSDVAAMCRGATETVNNTWGTEIAIDDAGVTGSNAVDHTTSAAVTANGTCAAGDTFFWRWQMDATGTTTAVATLHIMGMKMEYTANVGD